MDIEPEFLIIGAAKSGTTSLYAYLSEHPDVCMARVKEPHYFSGVKAPGHVHDWDEYLNLYPVTHIDQKCGEASVTTLPFYYRSIKRIIEKLGKDVKIIILLRNPVERAYSHYMYYVKLGYEAMEFQAVMSAEYRVNNDPWGKEFNPYIYPGLYCKQVSAFLEAFDHVHIILFEELIANPKKAMQELCDFLSVRFYPSDFGKSNVSGVVSNRFVALLIKAGAAKKISPYLPKRIKEGLRSVFLKKTGMKKSDRELLRSIYREDIEKLSKLINKDLELWN